MQPLDLRPHTTLAPRKCPWTDDGWWPSKPLVSQIFPSDTPDPQTELFFTYADSPETDTFQLQTSSRPWRPFRSRDRHWGCE